MMRDFLKGFGGDDVIFVLIHIYVHTIEGKFIFIFLDLELNLPNFNTALSDDTLSFNRFCIC